MPWPNKYVIALTGNIGTGKSVVRKMLEHLGAFTIDADSLSHMVIAKGGPGYTEAVKVFGEWVLGPDGQILRPRLGRIVFGDPEALARLESIIHPHVRMAVNVLLSRSKARVAAIEAIKIIETGLAKECDSLWVVHAAPSVQLKRLVEKRKLSPADAQQRIAAQPPQTDKLKQAHVIIDNSGTFEDTWVQVQAEFQKLESELEKRRGAQAPAHEGAPAVAVAALQTTAPALAVRRAKPNDAAQIASLISTATAGMRQLSRADVIAAFGDKAYMLAEHGPRAVALAGFKVENLVSRVDELYVAPGASLAGTAGPLLEAVEIASRELQCEAALVFVTEAQAAAAGQALTPLGYQRQTAADIKVDAWRDAARDSQPAGSTLFFKKLREDRVLRPV
jgi:dephospho-CoA kinase